MAVNVVFDVNTYVTAVADRMAPPLPKDLRLDGGLRNPGILALSVLLESRLETGGFRYALFSSRHIELNIVHVLRRGFGWEREQLLGYVGLIRRLVDETGGAIVPGEERISDCADFEDNKILAVASDAMALDVTRQTLIVSNDFDLTRLSPWRGVPIISAHHFVERARH